MFKGLANLAQMMKQAQEAQARMGEMKDRMAKVVVTGNAGGGLVEVRASGLQEVLSCRIDPSLLRPEDREVVEDLVVAAVNDALRKVKESGVAELSQLMGGMDAGAIREMLSGFGGH